MGIPTEQPGALFFAGLKDASAARKARQ